MAFMFFECCIYFKKLDLRVFFCKKTTSAFNVPSIGLFSLFFSTTGDWFLQVEFQLKS